MNKNKLIFIVDDDQFINALVSKKLASDGYDIETFENGNDCLKALDRNPDLVILDYYFSNNNGNIVLNGMEIFDLIRKEKPGIRVIMLSGQDKGEIVLELARKGVDDYIIKDKNLVDNLDLAVADIFGSS